MPPLRRTLGGGIERGRRARGSPCICGAWRGFLRRCILPRQEREALRPAGIPAKRAEQHNIMQISRPANGRGSFQSAPRQPRSACAFLWESVSIRTDFRRRGATPGSAAEAVLSDSDTQAQSAVQPAARPMAQAASDCPFIMPKTRAFFKEKNVRELGGAGRGKCPRGQKSGCRLTPTAARCSLLCFARKVPQNDCAPLRNRGVSRFIWRIFLC